MLRVFIKKALYDRTVILGVCLFLIFYFNILLGVKNSTYFESWQYSKLVLNYFSDMPSIVILIFASIWGSRSINTESLPLILSKPLSRYNYLLTKAMSSFLFFLALSLLLYPILLLSSLAFGTSISLNLSFVLIFALFLSAFYSIGMLISTITSPKKAPVVALIIVILFVYLESTFHHTIEKEVLRMYNITQYDMARYFATNEKIFWKISSDIFALKVKKSWEQFFNPFTHFRILLTYIMSNGNLWNYYHSPEIYSIFQMPIKAWRALGFLILDTLLPLVITLKIFNQKDLR